MECGFLIQSPDLAPLVVSECGQWNSEKGPPGGGGRGGQEAEAVGLEVVAGMVGEVETEEEEEEVASRERNPTNANQEAQMSVFTLRTPARPPRPSGTHIRKATKYLKDVTLQKQWVPVLITMVELADEEMNAQGGLLHCPTRQSSLARLASELGSLYHSLKQMLWKRQRQDGERFLPLRDC
ncbi:hypothetical protein QTO34_006819 [Cnephaeus nilssonii]|uniref:Uncharacterized protein n=1 Tax=Cnephaeus nilssonii TaxID=3371016 RepID=A0AA40HLA5_CNENI|nr:hypothetical protein QTO34_006819 [Eptesicus nilssonii]